MKELSYFKDTLMTISSHIAERELKTVTYSDPNHSNIPISQVVFVLLLFSSFYLLEKQETKTKQANKNILTFMEGHKVNLNMWEEAKQVHTKSL